MVRKLEIYIKLGTCLSKEGGSMKYTFTHLDKDCPGCDKKAYKEVTPTMGHISKLELLEEEEKESCDWKRDSERRTAFHYYLTEKYNDPYAADTLETENYIKYRELYIEWTEINC